MFWSWFLCFQYGDVLETAEPSGLRGRFSLPAPGVTADCLNNSPAGRAHSTFTNLTHCCWTLCISHIQIDWRGIWKAYIWILVVPCCRAKRGNWKYPQSIHLSIIMSISLCCEHNNFKNKRGTGFHLGVCLHLGVKKDSLRRLSRHVKIYNDGHLSYELDNMKNQWGTDFHFDVQYSWN